MIIHTPTHLMKPLRQPLLRLLAVNLAIGVSVAALMLGGLLALNPHSLRDPIVADNSPLVAAGLLLFGLVVTFGSVAMGTAIMMIGQGGNRGDSRNRRPCVRQAAAGLPSSLPDLIGQSTRRRNLLRVIASLVSAARQR